MFVDHSSAPARLIAIGQSFGVQGEAADPASHHYQVRLGQQVHQLNGAEMGLWLSLACPSDVRAGMWPTTLECVLERATSGAPDGRSELARLIELRLVYELGVADLHLLEFARHHRAQLVLGGIRASAKHTVLGSDTLAAGVTSTALFGLLVRSAASRCLGDAVTEAFLAASRDDETPGMRLASTIGQTLDDCAPLVASGVLFFDEVKVDR